MAYYEEEHIFSKNERNMPDANEIDSTLVSPQNFLDYRFVEYQLSSIINNSKVYYEIDKIHDVTNEQVLHEKLEQIESSEWTYGWYTVSPDKYPDIIAQYKTKGFIPDDDKSNVFQTGSLIEDPKTLSQNLYLLCIISIGHSLIVKKDKDLPKKIPEYYCSFKWKNDDNNTHRGDVNGISSNSPFYSYSFLPENVEKNVYPLFLVKLKNQDDFYKFKVDDNSTSAIQANFKENENKIFCFKCSKLAEYFCKNCEAYYDETCKNSNHPSGSVQHEFIKIKFKQKTGSCSKHNNVDAEYYCVTCNRPICSSCKVKIGENEPPHQDHEVKDIYDAFEKRQKDSINADKVISRAKEQLAKVKSTIKQLLEKQVQIEREIDREFRNENDEIQSLTKAAKLKNYSVIAELSEMKRHIETMDHYFKERKTTMFENNLKAEAIWINDNHEEVITDIYRNFDKIRVDNYQVTSDMFDKIKETSLKITKKLKGEKKKEIAGKGDLDKADFLIFDSSLKETKKIVTLSEKKKQLSDKKFQEEEKKKKKPLNMQDNSNYPLTEKRVTNAAENSKNMMQSQFKREEKMYKKFENKDLI